MAANSRYGITLKQLRELMEHRGREGVEKVPYANPQSVLKKSTYSTKS
jgi:hypothetical protein